MSSDTTVSQGTTLINSRLDKPSTISTLCLCGFNSAPLLLIDESKLAEKALQLHNVFRLIHHAPPLHWSNALEAVAKNMARRLAE